MTTLIGTVIVFGSLLGASRWNTSGAGHKVEGRTPTVAHHAQPLEVTAQRTVHDRHRERR
jgi:hypothetical protein